MLIKLVPIELSMKHQIITNYNIPVYVILFLCFYYSQVGTSCAFQSVFEDVAMTETTTCDRQATSTMQYVVTLTDAEVYTCDVTRSSVKHESHCDQLGGAEATDGIIIICISEYLDYKNTHLQLLIKTNVCPQQEPCIKSNSTCQDDYILVHHVINMCNVHFCGLLFVRILLP